MAKFCTQPATHSRIIYFPLSPRIHNNPNVPDCLRHLRPSVCTWRGDINHIKSSSRCEEARWSASLAFIIIHKDPDNSPELRRCEFGGSPEDTFFLKQEVRVVTIPHDRLPFYETSAQSIIYPDALPFARVSMSVTNQQRERTNAGLSPWCYVVGNLWGPPILEEVVNPNVVCPNPNLWNGRFSIPISRTEQPGIKSSSMASWKEVQSPTLNQSTKRSDNRRDISSATQGYIYGV